METKTVTISVNGREYTFGVGNNFGDIQPNESLLSTLRDRLGLTGAKSACEEGACGACTVIMNGKAVSSCMQLTVGCNGKSITTIEGLTDPKTGELHPVQKAFIDYYAFQCGYCTPGIIMTTKALLDEKPNPTRKEVEEALSGNHCRCISQYHVMDAVMSVAEKGVN
ncbi:(2Fe-2S)-binding protein [Acetobacterium sp. K1/6]|uniref:(2Fe-2S)-binding protein n=1 Tax=Acetobacterium sp. K1/6 TaxID=3055467 RepID=UPI002ACA85B8|nr:(2Fe-2S)-binding protein [Acetobacterium sp. K1/6]MDZ5726207.1 (2Fe-2S)-binding protein [Acetobacterium sp. K1/6]